MTHAWGIAWRGPKYGGKGLIGRTGLGIKVPSEVDGFTSLAFSSRQAARDWLNANRWIKDSWYKPRPVKIQITVREIG